MDFSLRRRAGGPAGRGARPARQGVRRLRAAPRGRPPRTRASTRSCGSGWPRWASSGCRSPRSTAAWAPGPLEVGIVAEELGRVLAPEPFLTSVVLAGGLVAAAGSRRAGAPSCSGRWPRARACSPWPTRSRGAAGTPTPRAVDGAPRSAARGASTGSRSRSPAGARADVLVVSARSPDGGDRRCSSSPATPRGSRAPATGTHDGGRAARVVLERHPGEPLGERASTRRRRSPRPLDAARVAACAEVARRRWRPRSPPRRRTSPAASSSASRSSTFQALDVPGRRHVRRARARPGASCSGRRCGSPTRRRTLRRRAGRGRRRASRGPGSRSAAPGGWSCQEAVQLHGGIGMTAEYAVGHHLSRLTVLESLFGDGDLPDGWRPRRDLGGLDGRTAEPSRRPASD